MKPMRKMKARAVLIGIAVLAALVICGTVFGDAVTGHQSNGIGGGIVATLLLGAAVGMALSADTPRTYELGDYNDLPVAATTTIYEGSAVGDNASGYVRALVAGDPFRGFAIENTDNSAGDAGDILCRVLIRGVIQATITSVAITNVDDSVYMSDDGTFTLTPGSNTLIGTVKRYVTTNTAMVYFDALEQLGTVSTSMLAADSVTGAKIADDAVDSEHIAAGAIDLAHMSANSIDSDQYVDGSIDLAHMSVNSIDSDQYVDGSIDLAHLSADCVDGTKIADDAINSEHIAAGAVDLEHMSANSIDSDQYVDGSIDLAHLSADCVDGTKIADDAVDSEHIAAGAIDLAHMSVNSIDSDQYVDGSIDTAHLSADCVDGTKIADDAIDTNHIADGAVENAQLEADAVTGVKIAAESIDSDHYVDLSIDTAHLSADCVDGTKIADDAISLEHLDAGITPTHIVIAAGMFTTAGGDANETITVAGALITDVAVVSLHTKGSTPRVILTAAAASGQIDLVFADDPSTDHVVSWLLLRAVS